MVKILIGLIAAGVVAAGGFFGFEFYAQHRVAGEVEAAFEQIRATGAKASHGKVSFDPWSRIVAIADIAAESAAQPPVSVKITSFVASGVRQPDDPTRFSADSIEASDVEVDIATARPAGWHFNYKAPRIAITDYSGPQRLQVSSLPAAPLQFALEQFATVTASSITAPSLTTATLVPGAAEEHVSHGTYSNVALRTIKDGKIAAITVEQAALTISVQRDGKTETGVSELASAAVYDVDSRATLAMLDPARANDDAYMRAYGQIKLGSYTVATDKGARLRVESTTIDDLAVRPSRMRWPEMVESLETLGAAPTPAQTRAVLEKVAGIYEGVRIGNAEMHGLSVETPEGPLKLAAIRFNLENGKIGEFAFEGLEVRSPKGPAKVGRFALKSLDIANLLRMSSQFSVPGQQPSPEQLFGLLPLLEGAEVNGVVAPYKDSTEPVNVETLSLDWGQFIGPIPSKARLTVKMAVPLDTADPAQKMLVAAGISTAAINLDLGAAWTEGSRSFVLEPMTAELGGVLNASARVSLANVPREVFSTNPLQAALMATQIEAGTIELALRDLGGIDLAIAQYARTQNVSPDEARQAIINKIKAGGTAMAATNPDATAITDALVRFIENPRGTLTVKLTPQGKVPLTQLISALKDDPLTALARFQVEASTGR